MTPIRLEARLARVVLDARRAVAIARERSGGISFSSYRRESPRVVLDSIQAKLDFLKHPSWQVRSGRGRWVCPFCAKETDVEYPETASPEDVWGGVEQHLRVCRAYDEGSGTAKEPDELNKNKQRGERINVLAKSIQDIYGTQTVWNSFSEDLWDCPFCGNGVGGIDPPSKDAVAHRRAAVSIAKHLLFACSSFQERAESVEGDALAALLDDIPPRPPTAARGTTKVISLTPSNLQRQAVDGAAVAPMPPPTGGVAPHPTSIAARPSGISRLPTGVKGAPAPAPVPSGAPKFPGAAKAASDAEPAEALPAVPIAAEAVALDAFGEPQSGFGGQLVRDLSHSMTRLIEERSVRESEADRAYEEARKKQQRMLPPPPEVEGMEVAVVYQPCDMVGGDFYDFIKVKDGVSKNVKDSKLLGIVQGDVSGHGIEVWGDMAMGMKTMNIYAKNLGNEPRQMLIESNEDLVPDLMAKTFISAFYGVLNIETFEYKYARAGHNPMILFNTSRAPDIVQQFEPKGMVLGMARGDRFENALEEAELQLYSGDVLLWYTDGITEAMDPDGEEYSVERLCRCIEANGSQGAGPLLDAILRDVNVFCSGQELDDDITMVALRIH